MVFRFHFAFGTTLTSGSFYLYPPYAGQTAFSHPPELPNTCRNGVHREYVLQRSIRGRMLPVWRYPMDPVHAVSPFRYNFTVSIIYECQNRYKAYRKMGFFKSLPELVITSYSNGSMGRGKICDKQCRVVHTLHFALQNCLSGRAPIPKTAPWRSWLRVPLERFERTSAIWRHCIASINCGGLSHLLFS